VTGPVERQHRLAEWHAMHDADVTRLQADLAAHDGLLGCEGWLGSLPADLPDDDLAALGEPTTGHGTFEGPAEGHPLPRRVLQPLALVLIGVAIGGCVLALAWPWLAPLVHGWLAPDAVPVRRVLT